MKISLCQKDLLLLLSFLHYALAAAQCIVINPVCGCMGVYMGGSVTTINNTKLHASILTKLGLWVKVVTISSWLNFGRPAPPGRGLRQGENFWLRLTTASAQCLHLIWALFHFVFFPAQFFSGMVPSWVKSPKFSKSAVLDLLQAVCPSCHPNSMVKCWRGVGKYIVQPKSESLSCGYIFFIKIW